MSKTKTEQVAAPESTVDLSQMGAGVASLVSLPPKLQETVIASVLDARPQRTTDIWYQDKETSNVVVMRHGMQWQFNETASALWQRLGERVGDVLEEFYQQSPETDRQAIRFQVIEFLLHASSHGLIDLYPESPMEGK